TAPVKVGYFTGYGSRNLFGDGETDYDRLFYRSGENALSALGFDFVEVAPDVPVPGDIDILVVADPSAALPASVVSHIGRYLDAGGNLFLASSGRNAAVTAPLLRQMGLRWEHPGEVPKYVPVIPEAVITAG